MIKNRNREHKPRFDLSYACLISPSIAVLEASQVISQELVKKWIRRWKFTGFL